MTDTGTPEEPKPSDESAQEKGAFGWYKPPEGSPKQTLQEVGDISPRAMFEKVALYDDHPDLWDKDKPLRDQRFTNIFIPNLQAQSLNLGDEGKDFLARLVSKLKVLLKNRFQLSLLNQMVQ